MLNPLSILSARGSVGKTFLAVNLAHIMSKRGKKTLLIDADMSFGGLTRWLNLSKTDTTDFFDWLLAPSPIPTKEFIMHLESQTYFSSNLTIIPHFSDWYTSEQLSSKNMLQMIQRLFSILLEANDLGYCYVIFDVGTGYSLLHVLLSLVSNSIIFLHEDDSISKTIAEQMSACLQEQEQEIMKILDSFFNSNPQLLGKWYRTVHVGRKQKISLTVKHFPQKNRDKKNRELPYDSQVAHAYRNAQLIAPDAFFLQNGFDFQKINSTYLWQMMRLYHTIVQRYESDTQEFEGFETATTEIEKNIISSEHLILSEVVSEKDKEIYTCQQKIIELEKTLADSEAAMSSLLRFCPHVVSSQDGDIPQCHQWFSETQKHFVTLVQNNLPTIERMLEDNYSAIQQLHEQHEKTFSPGQNPEIEAIRENFRQKQEEYAQNLISLAKEVKEAQTQISNLTVCLGDTTTNRNILHEENTRLKESLNEITRNIETLLLEKDTWLQQKNTMQGELNCATQATQIALQHLQARQDEWTHNFNMLFGEKEKIVEEKKVVIQQNEEVRQEYTVLQQEFTSLQERYETLNMQYRKLHEESTRKITQTDQIRHELDTTNQYLQDECEKNKKSFLQLQQSQEQLQAEKKKLQQEKDLLFEEYNKLKTLFQNLPTQNQKNLQRPGSFEALAQENKKLIEQCELQNRKIQQQEQQIRQQEQQVRQQEQQINELTHDINTLYNKLREFRRVHENNQHVYTALVEFETLLKHP